ncbi:MAG TPA: PadR family transcriptional regulator [Rhizomicrobium sp.]|nr:PadR family transcriptional regulator [Rhizomicrobium sp.]
MWHFRNHEESRGYRYCAGRGGPFRAGFGRFGYGRGHGDGGGFGRRRGLYDGDELRLVLLSLIAEKPRHGYDLIKEIQERSGGLYAPSPGVIYPTLTMLQDMGLIVESDAAGTRKVYAATPDGNSHLASNKEHADELLARMTELKSAQKGDTAPVRRAMRNLYAALVEKLARADNDELMHKIAALLDEVTQKIERS